jgi:hypothetical protein
VQSERNEQKIANKHGPSTFVIQLIALWFIAAIPTSWAGNNNPPEVDALIGIRLKWFHILGSGKNEEIPGWSVKRGTDLSISPQPKQSIGVEEIYQGNGSFAFVVDLFDSANRLRTILDAQVLPRQLLGYTVKKGKIVWKKNTHQMYHFEPMCERLIHETVVGLMRPETGKEDCTHKSKQILRAWKINEQSGQITEISPQGVSCYWGHTEYDCQ